MTQMRDLMESLQNAINETADTDESIWSHKSAAKAAGDEAGRKAAEAPAKKAAVKALEQTIAELESQDAGALADAAIAAYKQSKAKLGDRDFDSYPFSDSTYTHDAGMKWDDDFNQHLINAGRRIREKRGSAVSGAVKAFLSKHMAAGYTKIGAVPAALIVAAGYLLGAPELGKFFGAGWAMFVGAIAVTAAGTVGKEYGQAAVDLTKHEAELREYMIEEHGKLIEALKKELESFSGDDYKFYGQLAKGDPNEY